MKAGWGGRAPARVPRAHAAHSARPIPSHPVHSHPRIQGSHVMEGLRTTTDGGWRAPGMDPSSKSGLSAIHAPVWATPKLHAPASGPEAMASSLYLGEGAPGDLQAPRSPPGPIGIPCIFPPSLPRLCVAGDTHSRFHKNHHTGATLPTETAGRSHGLVVRSVLAVVVMTARLETGRWRRRRGLAGCSGLGLVARCGSCSLRGNAAGHGAE